MRYLTLAELIELHRRVMIQGQGTSGVRDMAALESAVGQPHQTFDGNDLYPTFLQKAAALAFSVIQNHPFIDGNKRAGHAAMEVVLHLNGFEIDADVDEQEQLILGVASGKVTRAELTTWLEAHVAKLG